MKKAWVTIMVNVYRFRETGVALLLQSLFVCQATASELGSILTQQKDAGYSQENYNTLEVKNTVPGMLVDGRDLVLDTSVTYLDKKLMSSWFGYFEELNFYDTELLQESRKELSGLFRSGNLYFILNVIETDDSQGEVKARDIRGYIQNNEGLVLNAINIVEKQSINRKGLKKYIITFPDRVPAIFKSTTSRYIVHDRTKFIRLFIWIKDSVYMYKLLI